MENEKKMLWLELEIMIGNGILLEYYDYKGPVSLLIETIIIESRTTELGNDVTSNKVR